MTTERRQATTNVPTQPVGEADGMRVAQGEASAASETLGSMRQSFMWAASTNLKQNRITFIEKGEGFSGLLESFQRC